MDPFKELKERLEAAHDAINIAIAEGRVRYLFQLLAQREPDLRTLMSNIPCSPALKMWAQGYCAKVREEFENVRFRAISGE